MKKLLLTLLLLLAVISLTAQQSLLGKVTDEQGDPLPRASLRVQAGSKMVKFTSSDNDGNFAFAIDSLGSNNLLITAYLGKRADTLRLATSTNLTNLTIRLADALESLPSVEVVGDRTTVEPRIRGWDWFWDTVNTMALDDLKGGAVGAIVGGGPGAVGGALYSSGASGIWEVIRE